LGLNRALLELTLVIGQNPRDRDFVPNQDILFP